jgi:hypothetical protein
MSDHRVVIVSVADFDRLVRKRVVTNVVSFLPQKARCGEMTIGEDRAVVVDTDAAPGVLRAVLATLPNSILCRDVFEKAPLI